MFNDLNSPLTTATPSQNGAGFATKDKKDIGSKFLFSMYYQLSILKIL